MASCTGYGTFKEYDETPGLRKQTCTSTPGHGGRGDNLGTEVVAQLNEKPTAPSGDQNLVKGEQALL